MSKHKEKKKEKKPQKQGSCIFCESTGMTKQHLLPDWLRNVVPRTPGHYTSKFDFQSLRKSGRFFSPQLKMFDAPMGTRKARNVCEPCNTGWMNTLEQQAKPLLEPLLLNQDTILGETEKRILVRWIIMTSIMMEYTENSPICIPKSEYKKVMEGEVEFPMWKIWIGKFHTDLGNMDYKKNGLTLANIDDPESVQDLINKKPNTQITTLYIENLFIHAASLAKKHDQYKFDNHINVNLRSIYPYSVDTLDWSDIRMLEEYEFNYITNHFNTLISVGPGYRRNTF